jgi:hypothetical protein
MDTPKGLYAKYTVIRNDGADLAGKKHCNCFLFVLDGTHDVHARHALEEYAKSCEVDYPELAADIRGKLAGLK